MKSLFEYYKVNEREFSKDKRAELADKGLALSDGSFPIENKEDLKNAIKLAGLGKDPSTTKEFIKKRAKELGAEDMIPSTWLNEGLTYDEAISATRFDDDIKKLVRDLYPDNAKILGRAGHEIKSSNSIKLRKLAKLKNDQTLLDLLDKRKEAREAVGLKESIELNEKKYAKPPKAKKEVKEEEDYNYPQELEDVIEDLELEIESYFDDHDEVMTSTIYDYVIETIKSRVNEEDFDHWDKNYNHEIIRDVLDIAKENKAEIVENAIKHLFSKESRILDDIKEDLEEAKAKHKAYESDKAKRRKESLTETDFDPEEGEEEDDEEGTIMVSSVENLESQLTKKYYIREYKKLFDKHFKGVSNKIKKISR